MIGRLASSQTRHASGSPKGYTDPAALCPADFHRSSQTFAFALAQTAVVQPHKPRSTMSAQNWKGMVN